MKKKLKNIKAIGERIFLIKDIVSESLGGILLLSNEEVNLPPYTGTIISVGNKVEDEDYKPGVRVLFHDLAGFEFEYEGQKIYNIRERDIAAIVEKNVTIE
jgi:co-chaperonin GroES (HSP10)